MNKALWVIGTTMELIGAIGLAAIALKRNNDAYKAGVKCAELEMALAFKDLEGTLKDAEIKGLKKQLEELKKQQKEES